MDQIFLNARQVTQAFGLKRSTLYALAKTREIPFYRIKGTITLFHRDDLLEFMLKHRVEAKVKAASEN
jgi:excisionase family DNA binding protein